MATAKRDFPNVGSRRLLSVVLGAASENARANESQKLLNWGYTAFEAVKLFDAGQAVVTPQVWKGKSPTLKLGRSTAIVVAVPAGSAAQIKTQVQRPDPLVAPFAQGPGRRHAQGVHRRPSRWSTCRWWHLKPSSRPACWAGPGMQCGSGSSNSTKFAPTYVAL